MDTVITEKISKLFFSFENYSVLTMSGNNIQFLKMHQSFIFYFNIETTFLCCLESINFEGSALALSTSVLLTTFFFTDRF